MNLEIIDAKVTTSTEGTPYLEAPLHRILKTFSTDEEAQKFARMIENVEGLLQIAEMYYDKNKDDDSIDMQFAVIPILTKIHGEDGWFVEHRKIKG